VALTLGVIAVITLVHLLGIRLAVLVNNVGVWTELFGMLVLSPVLIAIALARRASPAVLWSSANAASALPPGLDAWALSLLVGARCLTGFEATADLVEETRQPRRVVPRAMLISLLSSGVAGFLLLGGVMLVIRDLPAAQRAANPLRAVLGQALGERWAALALVVVGVSVFACGPASMAATSRLLFALARVRMLPGSRWLAFVEEGHRTPRIAILFVWAVSSAVVLGLPSLDIITQISALTWVPGVVAALTIPPTPLPGIATRHLPALSTGIAFAVGVAFYLGLIRRRLRRGEAGPPTAAALRHE
jgi:amino acid transporter